MGSYFPPLVKPIMESALEYDGQCIPISYIAVQLVRASK
jgi:hypothetical protein